MKSTILSLSVLCFLLTGALWAQTEDKVRDPFLPPAFELSTPRTHPGQPIGRPGSVAPGETPGNTSANVDPIEIEPPQAVVTGIVSSSEGRVALLVSEDRTLEVREGDQLGALKVTRIAADKVVLSVENHEFVLPFSHI